MADSLEKIVRDKFRILIEEYGFSMTTRNYGREVYFDFDRGFETISISVEIGSSPIVEILAPASQFNGESVPWAEKRGIQRGRRLPKLEVSQDFSNRPAYLEELATQLARKEREWLQRGT